MTEDGYLQPSRVARRVSRAVSYPALNIMQKQRLYVKFTIDHRIAFVFRFTESISISFLARMYESTGRAIAVTPASALASASALLKMLKFLVKVFMSLYLLKLLMDQVDTLHVDRYWSEVLCCTIMTHLGDFEVKVTDLEIFC